MKNFEERFLKMEKTIRMYRIFFGVIIVAGSALTLMASGNKQFVPDRIQAKSFEVVDDNGNVLVKLENETNSGSITTFARSGRKQVSMFMADGGGGGINTFSPDGKVNFKVTNTTGGGGYMAILNNALYPIYEVGATTQNSGYMKMNDSKGAKLAWLTYTTDGGAYFSLYGKDNKEQLKFTTPKVGGRIGIYNNDDIRVAYIGTQESKSGNMTIYNSTGTRTGGLPE